MLSDNDLELLSAYIDGALSETERTALESRLRADPELRRELARLQAAVDLVKSLPPLAAPRDFRLTRRMARRPAVWTSAAFSLASAAAAIILLIFGAALFRLSGSAPLPAAVSNQVALLPTSEVSEATKLGDEEASEAVAANSAAPGADGEVAQAPQESRDLGFAAVTTTPPPTLAPQLFAAVLPTQTASAADLLSDTLSETAADQALPESQQAAPSVAGGAAAEAPLPAPTLLPSATPTSTSTLTPTASPTPTPSLTPTPPPTATPTSTPTSTPTLTPTPVPPASVLAEPGTVGGGLIVLALILFGVAIVTTLARRRG